MTHYIYYVTIMWWFLLLCNHYIIVTYAKNDRIVVEQYVVEQYVNVWQSYIFLRRVALYKSYLTVLFYLSLDSQGYYSDTKKKIQ